MKGCKITDTKIFILPKPLPQCVIWVYYTGIVSMEFMWGDFAHIDKAFTKQGNISFHIFWVIAAPKIDVFYITIKTYVGVPSFPVNSNGL